MKLLKLGTINKVKGLNGEVKVYSVTDFAPLRYKIGNKVLLKKQNDNNTIEVTVKSFYSKDIFDYVSFEEFPSIEDITPYIGYDIVIDKDKLPELEDGLYYFCDLENCEVIDENNNHIGKVNYVDDFNGRKVLRVTLDNKKEIQIPFVDFFVKNVDINKKIITVNLIEGMIE